MSKQTTPGFIHQFEPDSSNRTLLLLHGTGGNEKDLLSLGRALDPEAALLSPRGKVLENGMPRFLRRLAEGGALGYSNGANLSAAPDLPRFGAPQH
jgi:phospholipase/carboxylesterase